MLTKVYNRRAIDVDEVCDEYGGYAESLAPHIADTGLLLAQALDDGKVVLLEGSQGTLLDVDHGSYPFVTSSNPTAGGASTGSGIGPNRLSRAVGIVKAYTTRVGSGPFPTELDDENGERLRSVGGEFGVTTGPGPALRLVRRGDRALRGTRQRPHRPVPHQARRALRARDDPGLRRLRRRRRAGRRDADDPDRLPPRHPDLRAAARAGPATCRRRASSADLPSEARAYIAFLEEQAGCPISAIGVGPGRDETIVVRDLV